MDIETGSGGKIGIIQPIYNATTFYLHTTEYLPLGVNFTTVFKMWNGENTVKNTDFWK